MAVNATIYVMVCNSAIVSVIRLALSFGTIQSFEVDRFYL